MAESESRRCPSQSRKIERAFVRFWNENMEDRSAWAKKIRTEKVQQNSCRGAFRNVKYVSIVAVTCGLWLALVRCYFTHNGETQIKTHKFSQLFEVMGI